MPTTRTTRTIPLIWPMLGSAIMLAGIVWLVWLMVGCSAASGRAKSGGSEITADTTSADTFHFRMESDGPPPLTAAEIQAAIRDGLLKPEAKR